MGFAQNFLTPVYKDNTACIEWGNNRELEQHHWRRQAHRQSEVLRRNFDHKVIKIPEWAYEAYQSLYGLPAGGYLDQASPAVASNCYSV
jgi:hypothetical protein